MPTQLITDREQALRVGYAATDWSRPVPYDEYLRAVEDWEVQCIQRDGECIGTVYRHPRTGEVHVSVLPPWRRRWVTRGLLRQILSGPRVLTRVSPGHDYMYDILHRLGFRPTAGGYLVKEQ